jgi:hypothetical protein
MRSPGTYSSAQMQHFHVSLTAAARFRHAWPSSHGKQSVPGSKVASHLSQVQTLIPLLVILRRE